MFFNQGCLLYKLQQSHIQANIPSANEFDKLLQKDLNTQFQSNYGNYISVEYEYLREGPTQSGVAYPKYYLWVKILNNDKLIDEGAVRVAAMEQNRYEITHYITKSQMKEDPKALEIIFPKPVVDKILQKI